MRAITEKNAKNDKNNKNIKNRADRALFWAAMLFLCFAALDYYFTAKLSPGVAIGIRIVKGTAVAALIGGIADWYGVTSIFGKPLHISFKTEIAINRKDSFIESIKDFIGDDILSEQNVRLGFERLQITDRLLDLLEEEKGKPEGLVSIISDFLARISLGVLTKLDINKISGIVKTTILDQLIDKKPSKILLKILREIGENRQFERAVSKIATELEGVMKLEGVRTLVDRAIDMAILNYTEKSKGRGLVADIVQDRLKKAVFENIEGRLLAFKKMDSTETENLKRLFIDFLADLETNELLLYKIDKTFMNYIKENNTIEEKIEELLASIAKDEQLSEETTSKYVEMGLRYLLDMLLKDAKLIAKLEGYISEYLITQLNKNRNAIKGLVDKNLRVMPDRELIDFLRVNTENELQYIRLNGMFFGTLIGLFVAVLKLTLGIA